MQNLLLALMKGNLNDFAGNKCSCNGYLWFDLSRHKDNHTVGLKEAALRSGFWVVLSFCLFIAGKIILSVTDIIHLSPLVSLGFVGLILTLGIISSYIWPEDNYEE